MSEAVNLNIYSLRVTGPANPEFSAFTFDEALKDHPYTRLINAVLHALKLRIQKLRIDHRMKPELLRRMSGRLAAPGVVNLDCYLYSNRALATHFNLSSDYNAIHGVRSGIFKDVDESAWASTHRLFICVDPTGFLKWLERERASSGLKHSGLHDEDHLYHHLMYIFEEVSYGLDYIENGNGFTPKELRNAGIDPFFPSFGVGAVDEIDDMIKGVPENEVSKMMDTVLYDPMVARIKEKAKALFRTTDGIYDDPSWTKVMMWAQENAHS